MDLKKVANPQSSKIILSAEGLKKRYRKGTLNAGTFLGGLCKSARGKSEDWFWALDGIDLKLRQGEAVGIIGDNGAGKSTLLKILSRITAPTEGEVRLQGRTAAVLEVGAGFHPDMTGAENIYFAGALMGMRTGEIKERLEQIVAFSEIGSFVHTPVKHYSSGMYVRLAFAVAAHLTADILIMDEVLAVGDLSFQQKCLQKLQDLSREGKSILYVSHNLSTIRGLCRRCIVMQEGKIVFDGDTERAIAFYTGGDQNTDTSVAFTGRHRPFDRMIRTDTSWNFTALQMDGGGSAFRMGDALRLRITYQAACPVQDLRLRMEICTFDGTKCGAMLSDSALALQAGEASFTAVMDTGALPAGSYHADLIAYRRQKEGKEQILDGVYPGFSFVITEDVDQAHPVLWNKQYWGAVRLPDVVISAGESSADSETGIQTKVQRL